MSPGKKLHEAGVVRPKTLTNEGTKVAENFQYTFCLSFLQELKPCSLRFPRVEISIVKQWRTT